MQFKSEMIKYLIYVQLLGTEVQLVGPYSKASSSQLLGLTGKPQEHVLLTCVSRAQVGQSYDPVPSSNTLHHVVAAVFAPTGTQHDKQTQRLS